MPFAPERYHDEHRERVLEYLEQAAEGRATTPDRDRRPDADVIDLTAALERSLGGGGRSGAEPDADAYASMTRDELYERAQERDLGGRSSMTKAELVSALRSSDDAVA